MATKVKKANDSSNKYNTSTGKLNPNYKTSSSSSSNIIQYDTKTGKQLAQGATTTDSFGNVYKQGTVYNPADYAPIRNYAAANGGAGYNILSNQLASGTINPDSVQASVGGNQGIQNLPMSNVVNTKNLGVDNKKLNFLETDPNYYLKDYSLDIPGATEPQKTDLQKAERESDDILQKMMDSINDVPDTARIEKKLRSQLQIEQKQQVVNDLTGQLNGIVAQGQANQLSVVGQGRGIPEAIIGGQQAQMARETAIASLPVAAQLAAAQGNLEMANDSLDRLFKIYSDDAQNQYNARNKMYEVVYGVATKKEQRLLDEEKIKSDRAYQETKDLHTEQSSYAKMAFENGQSSLGAKIAKLDYKSPTFKEDLAKLQGELKDPVQVAQLAKLNAEINKLNREASGNSVSGVNEDLTAYANRYADTGQIPSPSELKLSGLSVGQVTMMAKQIPRPNNSIVNTNTGVKPSSTSLSPAQEDGIIAARDADKKLERLQELYNSKWISIPFSETRTEFKVIKEEFVDLLARARTGAVINDEEARTYGAKIPSIHLGIRPLGNVKLDTLRTQLSGKLDTVLTSQGVSIYGYSQVPVGGTMRTVGEVIDIGGEYYRVLPDGTLTDVL